MAAAMRLCVRRGAATMGGMKREEAAAASRFSEIIQRNSTTSAPVVVTTEEKVKEKDKTQVRELESLKKERSSLWSNVPRKKTDEGLVERVSKIMVKGGFYRFCDRSYSRESWDAGQVTTPFIPCRSFEVLGSDPSKWLPLELPPCDPVVRDALLPEINFEYLVAGPYILRWVREYGGALRFDVTRPEQGWTEVDVPDLIYALDDAEMLLIELQAEMLLIELQQSYRDGYLIFACKRGRYRGFDKKVEHEIQVVLLSQECDSSKRMQPLPLLPLLPHDFGNIAEWNFLHLGGQKVQLALDGSGIPQRGGLPYVILITFEYEIIATEEGDVLDVKCTVRTISHHEVHHHPHKLYRPTLASTDTLCINRSLMR
ncbi:hypothetical protein RchiOBHm_Chr3g0494201 [Rosa chinensis]|uniref:Uncharacterized protein n=1 Tax=Rosa chinensis TaxID=74649 RepID=A0A2P6RGY6_ROSCH|nr:uncharacterized protein LOC112194622 [Rosa chinensis]PRQ45677.1 hypothetical protein RchiOBHm_Chr3g0494201 [Rosa chinensis]